MNKTFGKRQRSFLWRLAVFSVALFGLHYAFMHHILKIHAVFYPLWQLYGFHSVTVFLVYTAVNLKYARGKKKIFPTFMALTFFKMALAIVFLLPLLFSNIENKQADVFNFFIPYFLFLAMEVYCISEFLRRS